MTVTMPAEYGWGFVIGKVIHAHGDRALDDDRLPDASAASGTVTFTPLTRIRRTSDALVIHEPVICAIGSTGHIVDAEGMPGAWLVAGSYTVSFLLAGGATYPPFPITVTTAHTIENPQDLASAAPYVPATGTTVTTMLVPSGATVGDVLTWTAGGLAWGAGGSGGGGDTVTPVSANTATPDGTVLGSLVGYWNTTGGALIVDGVTLPAGRVLVLMWNGTAWVQPLPMGSGDDVPVPPVEDTTAPTVPTGLAVTGVTATGCTLTWTASTDAGGMSHYLVTSDGGTTTHLVTAGGTYATEWIFTDLTPSTAYTLGVKAVDLSGNQSDYATVATTTPSGVGNTAPTAPTGLAGTASATTMALTWTAATDDVAVVAYRVSSNNGATWITSSVTATNYTVTGLTAGTSYAFAVQAGDGAGLWGPSATLTKSTTAAVVETALLRWGLPEGTGTTSAEASGSWPGRPMVFNYASDWGAGWGGAGYSIGGDLRAPLPPYPGVELAGKTGVALSLHVCRVGYIGTYSKTLGSLDGYDVGGQPVLVIYTVAGEDLRATAFLQDGSPVTVIATPSAFTTGEWDHVGASWEAGTRTLTLYRAGLAVGSTVAPGASLIRATVNSFRTDANIGAVSMDSGSFRRDNIRIFDAHQAEAAMSAWATTAVTG